MEEKKLDKDKSAIRKSWHQFISLVKKDLEELIEENDHIESKYNKYERILEIIKQNDINFLINHKQSIININGDLERKFNILERFKQGNNLDNDVAINIYKDILKTLELMELEKESKSLYDKSKTLKDKISDLFDLVNGEDYSKIDLIDELCQKHNIDTKTEIQILTYPAVRLINRPTVKKEQTITINEPETISKEESEEIVEENENHLSKFKETNTYLEELKKQRDRYNAINQEYKDLVDKYYNILQNMTGPERDNYKGYCQLTEEELGKALQKQKNYYEVKAKITAMKLFAIKHQDIDGAIKVIENDHSEDLEYIDILKDSINAYKKLCQKLRKLDKNIVDTKNTLEDETNIFFLLDDKGKSFIPKDIELGSLLSYIKDQTALSNASKILSTKNKPLFELDEKKFDGKINKKVNALIIGGSIISYVKLKNSDNIILLTVSANKGKTDELIANTNKIINANRTRIIEQVKLIEERNQKYLEAQKVVRKNINHNGNPNKAEGENYGRKTR